MKKVLITGITGQDGAYLAKLLLKNNYKVIGTTRSYNNANFRKLKYLNIFDKIEIQECDLLDISNLINLLSSNNITNIYNLSSQSSVGLSYSQPIDTFKFNTLSVLNILEAIKVTNNNIKFYQASSSEMFGDVPILPITENIPMNPISPYGVSKASAHWLVSTYRESYNIFACSGILFNHESYLRNNNFFIKKVIVESLMIKYRKQQYLKVGNIDVKRDFGFAPDYVEAMYLMMQQKDPDDYIICSGQSLSLKEIILYVFDKLGLSHDKIQIDETLYRPSEIMDIYGSSKKAKDKLGWNYNISFFDVIDLLIQEEEFNFFKEYN